MIMKSQRIISLDIAMAICIVLVVIVITILIALQTGISRSLISYINFICHYSCLPVVT